VQVRFPHEQSDQHQARTWRRLAGECRPWRFQIGFCGQRSKMASAVGHITKKRRLKPGAEYLNVDLEVRSRSDLTPLADEFSRSLSLLHAGRVPRTFLASFEADSGSLSPDAAINRLADAVSSLTPSARRLWKEARDRVFDIGVEAKSTGPDILALALRPETLRAIARLNARLAFTFYPPEERRAGESYIADVGANARRSSPKRSIRARVSRKRNRLA